MLSASADPWDVAKHDVETNIKNVEDMQVEWRRLLQSENTARCSRFQELHAEIVGELTQLHYDLQDCTATIECVEKDPTKYHISAGVIEGRKEFVRKSRAALGTVKESVDKAQTKIDADKRQALLGQKKPGQDDRSKAASASNDQFLRKQEQEQARMIGQQDEALDELSKSAQRLGQTARTINIELQDQQRMLAELDEDIDKETEKLNFVMKRMGRLMQTSDNKQICLIIGLFVLAVVLVFLIINT